MKSNTQQSQNKLYWIYLIGFFLILALPLLNLPPWFSPPDWGKTVVFRVVISILIFLLIYQILFGKDKFSVFQRIVQRISAVKTSFYLLTALLGIYLLATIFSRDILFSLWGNPYRSGGFVNFAFYIIFAILAFLIVRQKDWQKIWIFAIIGGILVSIVAVFQQFGILSEIFIPQATQLGSTIGGPIFLGIYLLLVFFITLSFALKEKGLIKKILYLAPLPLFFTIIVLSTSQAAYLGLAIGFFWLLFFYSTKSKRIILLRVIIGLFIILAFGCLFYLRSHPEIFSKWKYNYVINTFLSWGIDESRISAWQVSSEAVKNRPIFGYGPENFNIGFDKYYDPSLPEIARNPEAHSSWWDRAHNFVFDIAVTAGIPALMIYLSLFGTLFWQLQKVKYTKLHENEHESTRIIPHALQATFIGYLVANFFSFDTFSSYLMSFLLVGYSLVLIRDNSPPEDITHRNAQKGTQKYTEGKLWKSVFISVLFCVLIWFIWQYNIKPFNINTQINIAKYLVGDKKCEAAFYRMDKILGGKSFLDTYLRLKYADFLMACEREHPEKTYEYAQKGTEFLKENIEIQPYYVRNWILLAGFMDVLIDKEQSQQDWEKMVQDTKSYLEKAEELSPKRQEVLIEWAKFGLVANNFQLMKEKSQKCIDVNPDLADCYWFKGLAEIFLGNLEESKKNLKIAEEKGFSVNSLISLTQLAKAHSIAKNYQELVIIYQKLIALKPEEPQYHATLAFVYKELKDYKKAREEAMKVLELQPEAREMVEEFLKNLH